MQSRVRPVAFSLQQRPAGHKIGRLQMSSKLQQIRTELKVIREWDEKFESPDTLDNIGAECRRIRREELLSMFYWLAVSN